MGLDMAIVRRTHYSAGDFTCEQYEQIKDILGRDFDNIVSEAVVITWRKANAIHGWFDRRAGGLQSLQEYVVKKEDIEALVKACETVLSDHTQASTLLPVMDGFFFGSLEYDEYYYQQLEYTINKCKELLNAWCEEEDYVYYGWY